ncbi:hypothetical protein LTR56_024000 [Elasticomyces elasticus]|nr:hypothetical protein LTR56_024000 [Elasticomyces elasticus]KAK3632189.1 hypothetical protein LTR22_020701 [Elasticomyces elasticus]KAK4906310.1 hypothetical protein LTR49_024508 [Elasticomyces elasticus]KAK5744294.1 hypothetical protein LTS12_023511 [Elasticomyces elasticus]
MAARKRKAIRGDEDDIPSSKYEVQEPKQAKPGIRKTERRITRTMKTDGPRQAVIATAELLENIMMHMPFKSVFTAQRVCTQFRDIVATSVQLQRKLFLCALVPSTTDRWTVVAGPQTSRNGTVVRVGSDQQLPSGLVTGFDGKTCLRKPAAILNPFLDVGWAQEGPATSESLARRVRYFEESLERYSKTTTETLMGTASWKRMYLTDQPCNQTHLSIMWELPTRPKTSGRITSNFTTDAPNGFTIGTLLDAALQVEKVEHEYFDGKKRVKVSGTSIADHVKQLENDTGKQAVMMMLRIGMQDVILPTQLEREMVEDA